jgi:mannose-6-phosphate isomerase-like protein (cupin superfamily)
MEELPEWIEPKYANGHGGLLIPRWIPKGWGGELWFANDRTNEYCGKKLLVIAGKQNSWHYHHTKDEVLLVDSGVLELLYAPADRVISIQDNIGMAMHLILKPGQAFRCQSQMRHRLIGLETCWIIEASTADIPGDTVRLIPGD